MTAPAALLRADDDLYSPNEVARLFRVTTPTIARWDQKGLLTSIRTPGNHRRFTAGPVNALLRGGRC